MPTYEYRCKDCGDELEVVQSFHDDAPTVCPSCGGNLRKVFGNIGITFKGSGFYKTDSRNGASRKKESVSAESSSSSESSSSDSKASDKTESKSADTKSSDKSDPKKPKKSDTKSAPVPAAS